MKVKLPKKKIIKLLLPPTLAILIVTGYSFGAMEVLAKTITTYVATITETPVPTACQTEEKTIVYAESLLNGEGWEAIGNKPSEGLEYERRVIRTNITKITEVLVPTLITVPDEPQISRKVVPEEKPAEITQTAENNYMVFQEEAMKQVQNVAEASVSEGGGQSSHPPVVIDTGVWLSFKKNVYQTLQDSNRPIQITFCYKGERYRVDIPAGADLMSLVDNNGYCGFLNLMAHFGGKKL